MILNEAHCFVFVHIPKCGGTSIRNVLEKYNRWPHKYIPEVRETPIHGIIDHAHIPLFTLREIYPESFEQVCSFESFALVRNPFDRFFSSVQQKMRMDMLRSNLNLGPFTKTEIAREIQEVVAYLSTFPDSPHQLPHNYIHFQRQVDFIFLENVQLVKNVFCLDQLDVFFSTIEKKTGISENCITKSYPNLIKNQSRQYKNNTYKWIDQATKGCRIRFKKYLPVRFNGLFRNITELKTSNVYANYLNPSLRNFIASYYKEDIELFDSICSRNTSTKS